MKDLEDAAAQSLGEQVSEKAGEVAADYSTYLLPGGADENGGTFQQLCKDWDKLLEEGCI